MDKNRDQRIENRDAGLALPQAGRFILVAGPRSLLPTLLILIARLAEKGQVNVLDGGNQFQAYLVARAARGQAELLERITVARAFTCYQMLSLLEQTPALPVPFVVLNLLGTFYDESVRAGERKRILCACLAQLNRLEQKAGGVVSIHPPAVASQTAVDLAEMLRASGHDTYSVEMAPVTPMPMRLF
jgi:hypothetical protein